METIKIENFKNMPDYELALAIVEKMQIFKHKKLLQEKDVNTKKLLERDVNLLQTVMINLQNHFFLKVTNKRRK